jgi:hypothetical protein
MVYTYTNQAFDESDWHKNMATSASSPKSYLSTFVDEEVVAMARTVDSVLAHLQHGEMSQAIYTASRCLPPDISMLPKASAKWGLSIETDALLHALDPFESDIRDAHQLLLDAKTSRMAEKSIEHSEKSIENSEKSIKETERVRVCE